MPQTHISLCFLSCQKKKKNCQVPLRQTLNLSRLRFERPSDSGWCAHPAQQEALLELLTDVQVHKEGPQLHALPLSPAPELGPRAEGHTGGTPGYS